VKKLVLMLAVAACSKKEAPGPTAETTFDLVEMKTTDAVNLTVSLHVMPPEPGQLTVEFFDDTSPVKQHCTATIPVAKFDANNLAEVTGKLEPRCRRPIEPAGIYARVAYDRPGKPSLVAKNVMIPGMFGGNRTLVDAKALEKAIVDRVAAAKPPVQPNPDPAIDGFVARITEVVDSIPAAPPAAPSRCPPALHGKLFLVPFDFALAIRNKTPVGNGWLLDVDLSQKDPIYDVARYASGQDYPRETAQRLAYLADKAPVFLRMTDVAIPDGKSTTGKLVGGLYAFDKGALACAIAVKLEVTAPDRAGFQTAMRAQLDKLILDL
jgi:hypothetical protein